MFYESFFGCELWIDITNTEILLLERWKSADSYMDEQKLLFLGKLRLNASEAGISNPSLFKYNCVKHQLGCIENSWYTKYIEFWSIIDSQTLILTWVRVIFRLTFNVKEKEEEVKVAVQKNEESPPQRLRTQIDKDFLFFTRIHTLSKGHHPAWTFRRKHQILIEQCLFIVNICTLTRLYEEPYFLCDKCGRFFGDMNIHIVLQSEMDNFWRDNKTRLNLGLLYLFWIYFLSYSIFHMSVLNLRCCVFSMYINTQML